MTIKTLLRPTRPWRDDDRRHRLFRRIGDAMILVTALCALALCLAAMSHWPQDAAIGRLTQARSCRPAVLRLAKAGTTAPRSAALPACVSLR